MTAAPGIALLHHAHDQVGESALWGAGRGASWRGDIGVSKVRTRRLAGGAFRAFDMRAIRAALALADDFGWPDFSATYLTTMNVGTDAAREPLAGNVLAIEACVRGHPTPPVAAVPARQRAAAGAFHHG
jgi:hypothetical protein